MSKIVHLDSAAKAFLVSLVMDEFNKAKAGTHQEQVAIEVWSLLNHADIDVSVPEYVARAWHSAKAKPENGPE